ncbi:hypothetical protein CLF_109268 [Clonorchis sinensis]|uniref:Uncharacterized protein n=1 Tax=Clonorchis sinensis TaxID=79923 RepID=G7YJ49_CLOSI|nr:hypothetical protein CLF_109268 [Clonorchis sinensis]
MPVKDESDIILRMADRLSWKQQPRIKLRFTLSEDASAKPIPQDNFLNSATLPDVSIGGQFNQQDVVLYPIKGLGEVLVDAVHLNSDVQAFDPAVFRGQRI